MVESRAVPVLSWMQTVDIETRESWPLVRSHILRSKINRGFAENGYPIAISCASSNVVPNDWARFISARLLSELTDWEWQDIRLYFTNAEIRRLRALVVLPNPDLALQGFGNSVWSGRGRNVRVDYSIIRRVTVVDETDRLLRESYQSWLPTVIQRACSKNQAGFKEDVIVPSMLNSLTTIRRFGVERGFMGKSYPRLVKMIMSATLTQDPSKLSQLDLHHPLLLTSGDRRYKLPEKLESYKLICESKLKPLYLVALLQDLRGEKSIVFTSSVESTHRLSKLLNLFGELPCKVREYSSLQHQSVRSKRLKAFREGKIEVLIASDAMTRGMDVEGVRNVINYDMPTYVKAFVHRAGRTARAGNKGRCFTLLRKDEVKRFRKILSKVDKMVCNVHPLPANSIERLRPVYSSALEKLKQSVDSKKGRKYGVRFKATGAGEK